MSQPEFGARLQVHQCRELRLGRIQIALNFTDLLFDLDELTLIRQSRDRRRLALVIKLAGFSECDAGLAFQ